jgi:hypothetical protein
MITIEEARKRYEAAGAKFYKADEVFVNARYRRDAAVRECEIALREIKKAQCPQESGHD